MIQQNFIDSSPRYRGTQVQSQKSARDGTFWVRYRGTEVHSSNCVKESFICDQVQRYKGTELKFSSYFSDLLEFLVKIDQGTEVHRYRAKNLPEMELFGSGTEVQRYTAQIVSRRAFFGTRYRGTKVQSSNF